MHAWAELHGPMYLSAMSRQTPTEHLPHISQCYYHLQRLPAQPISPNTGEAGCTCCACQAILVCLTSPLVKFMHLTDVDGVRLCRSKKHNSGRDAEQRPGGSSSGTTDRLIRHLVLQSCGSSTQLDTRTGRVLPTVDRLSGACRHTKD